MVRPRLSLFLFYLLATALSWAVWSPLVAFRLGYGQPASPAWHLLGSLGPAASAVIVSLLPFSPVRLPLLVERLSVRRLTARGLLLAIGLPVAIGVLGLLGQAVIAGSPVFLAGIGRSLEYPALGPLAVIAVSILFYGFGEEIGWRGYALPVVNRWFGGLSSALLMTLPWAAWHIPLLVSSPTYQSLGAAGLIGWLASLATGAVLLTYLFHLSGHSLVVVAIFHAFIDLAMTNAAVQPIGTQLMGAMVTLLGLAAAFGCSRITRGGFAGAPQAAAGRGRPTH
ncbi:MAG: CPBP family intramembrane glutamic endopeptidase [Allorhizobium sp.]